MRNYYYITTFNLTNLVVKAMLIKQNITEMTGLVVDFKLRSKLFLSFSEATLSAYKDFDNKLKSIYPDKEEHNVSQFSVANPSALPNNDPVAESLVEKFNGRRVGKWDSNCCSTIYFADNPEEDEDINLSVDSWMIKYEIYFTEDAIELSGNGAYIFSQINVPRTQFNSTYH